MGEYERITVKDSSYYDDMDRIDSLGGADILYNRLVKLEDKIENSTLINLPCKPGQKVWFVDVQYGTFKKFTKISKGIITMFHIRVDGSVGMVVDFGKYSHEFREDNTLPNTLFFNEEDASKRFLELMGGDSEKDNTGERT